MSVRKRGAVVVSIPGERSKPARLSISWTTRAEKNRAVESTVSNWARGKRGWWGVYVDITTLDIDGTGAVYINDNRADAAAQFRVEMVPEGLPAPVSAFSVTGGRR